MTVKQVDVLDGDLAAAARKLYVDSFTDLNTDAAQRHLMTDDELRQVFDDPRIGKYLALGDGGELTGLATFTNDLDAIPLIAPPFYARRWPEHYQQRRIWYIPFFAVAPAARGGDAFVEMFTEFYRIADAADGLVGMDICQFNEAAHRLPQAIRAQLLRLSSGRSKAVRVDTQSFWLYDMRGDTLTEGPAR